VACFPCRRHIASTFALLLAFAVSVGVFAAPAPIPTKDLFRTPRFKHASLSPNGAYLAGIAADDQGTRTLAIFDLKTMKISGGRGNRTYEIYSYEWVNNDRLFFNVSMDKREFQDVYEAARDRVDHPAPLASDSQFKWWTCLSSFGHNRPAIEIDPSIADSVWAQLPKGYVFGLKWTPKAEIAFCAIYDGGKLTYRGYDGEHWREVPLDPDTVPVMGADLERGWIWIVRHDNAAGFGLVRYNWRTGEQAAPVVTDPNYDMSVGALYFSPRTGTMIGVRYPQAKWREVWLDATYAAAQAEIDRRCPSGDNELVSVNRAEDRFVFRCTAPQLPATYLLLDAQNKKLLQIAAEAPWLANAPLFPTTPIAFTARDGVTLQGYLTVPADVSEAHPVPLVVLVHGGPWTRDEWTFNPEVQFLASRGYAVLQPNYRGSTGYSPDISLTHQYDFRQMHSDVTDAARKAKKIRGIDPNRIAIMGGSFGGYLAVYGAAVEKDVYRCAVSLCGVFDWGTTYRDWWFEKKSPGEEYTRNKVRAAGYDDAALDDISPLKHAADIRIPVLIAHGDDDRIVDVKESKKLAAAMKKAGGTYETFFRKFEGHGFYDDKTRIEFYDRVDAFLARYLRATP
jgi:acetyl esterase/lipase